MATTTTKRVRQSSFFCCRRRTSVLWLCCFLLLFGYRCSKASPPPPPRGGDSNDNNDNNREESVTFWLFDNGSSEGGVEVTMVRHDFPTVDDRRRNTDPGTLFAMKMSKHIPVAKFGQEPGTVAATKAFRDDGERITKFEQLRPITTTATATGPSPSAAESSNNNDNNHDRNNHDRGFDLRIRRVYLVAEGLQFVWPFVEAGHHHVVSRTVLPPVPGIDAPVVLESISDVPRVFRIINMFTDTESQNLIDHALGLTGTDALQRSTVRSTKFNDRGDLDAGRTSENAWDRTSPTARTIISRSFNITGIVEDAGKIDGLQIVRYKPGQGYNTHPDYLQKQPGDDFNFLPFEGGSNRFATVFLYLNDVEEGGCTVFPNAKTPRRAATPVSSVVPRHASDMFPEKSWERRLLKECYSRLVVPPRRGTAALFYSVTPDGKLDVASKHGACPVLKGMKWGANLWIWNKLRYGEIQQGGDPRQLIVVNHRRETVFVTWEGRPQKMLWPGNSTTIQTFEFHRFAAALGSFENKHKIAEFAVQTKPDNHPQVWTIRDVEKPQKHHKKRILIINNYLQHTVYITYDDEHKPGGELGPGLAMKVTAYALHRFRARLDSYDNPHPISEYVVQETTNDDDFQTWNLKENNVGFFVDNNDNANNDEEL